MVCLLCFTNETSFDSLSLSLSLTISTYTKVSTEYQTKAGPSLISPSSFARLRRSSGLSDDDYIASLQQGFSGKAKAGDGKSGQLFLMTTDKKVVVKTLKYYEAIFLKKILAKYLQHMNRYPGSLLCRFYDVLTLTEPSTNVKISLLVMPNVLNVVQEMYVALTAEIFVYLSIYIIVFVHVVAVPSPKFQRLLLNN